MPEIDLDKIMDNARDLPNLGTSAREYKKALMREACRQILALASERAKIEYSVRPNGLKAPADAQLSSKGHVASTDYSIDKESITGCINFLK